MYNWYVMSVWSGREKSLVKDIQNYDRNCSMEKYIEDSSMFVPTRETFFKRAGNIKKETSIMFPGYVFVETSMEAYDFLEYAKDLRRTFRNSVTVLRYGDSSEIAVRWEERLALMKLMDHEWCIETSRGFKENDRVKITEGPLVGHEGLIKKIDRHKMKALIEVEMFERRNLFEVGLQVIHNLAI